MTNDTVIYFNTIIYRNRRRREGRNNKSKKKEKNIYDLLEGFHLLELCSVIV